MEKLTFRNCEDTQLEEQFGLQQVKITELLTLKNWVESSKTEAISDMENHVLRYFQQNMIENLFAWNEQEWIAKFIGPIMTLISFTTKKTNSFHERSLLAVINGVEISGRVDGIIAAGQKIPKKPYFCLQEYTSTTLSASKKEKDTDSGDPVGQALSAMLVAQAINNDNLPVYGGYVRGRDWFFMVLEGKEYAISRQFDASEEDLLDIFRILKALKGIVAERIKLLEK
jgi:hypothetical protein